MTRRGQRKLLDRVDPALRDALQRSLERGFDPPAITSFTMTGASSLYGANETHYEAQSFESMVADVPAVQRPRPEVFDQITRRLANTSSRRQALKTLGAAAAAAVGAAFLKPFETASAVTCPSGRAACGNSCCPEKYSCSSLSAACCCPPGTTPCGLRCCNKGVACMSASQSFCGCPAGTTPCGSGTDTTCCPAGTTCPGVNSTACPPPQNSSTACVAANSTNTSTFTVVVT